MSILGHVLHTGNTHDALIEDAICKLNNSFHGFISRFGSCNTTTKTNCTINIVLLYTVHSYGNFPNQKTCSQNGVNITE